MACLVPPSIRNRTGQAENAVKDAEKKVSEDETESLLSELRAQVESTRRQNELLKVLPKYEIYHVK